MTVLKLDPNLMATSLSELDKNSLAHYGRKGMKWGQNIFGKDKRIGSSRRYGSTAKQTSSSKKKGGSDEESSTTKPKSQSSKSTSNLKSIKNKKLDSAASKEAIERAKRKAATKNRRILSDTDLKKKADRLELEKKYKDLSDADLSPAKRKVKKILSSAGEKVITAAAAGAMAYALKVAIDGEINRKDLAKYIAPNPNLKAK